jgi:hypothetical protein
MEGGYPRSSIDAMAHRSSADEVEALLAEQIA